MGNSRFRLSHVMPNVWFYKLGDIGRFRESQRRLLQARNSTKTDYCTSFPRSSSYHFGSTEGVCNFPGKDKAKRANTEHKRKTSSKGKKNKRFSFTFIDSTISAGCSCTATVDSIWRSRERDDSSSASSSESKEPATSHAKSPVLHHKNNVDRSNHDHQLEPRNKNHGLLYGYKNYVAGLPSPVQEYGDVGHENLRHVQALVRRVEEVFDLVPDPFMMDTTITCSTSCSRILSSSSSTTDEGEIQEDYFSSLVMEVKQRQRFVQDLEERRPSMIRPNTKLHNGRGDEKQKQISDKNLVPTSKNRSKFQSAGQKQVSVSITSFNSTSAAEIRAPTRVGKGRNQIPNKADKNSTRFSSSSKPGCPDFRSKSVRGGDSRPCISSTNQKSKPKVESKRGAKPVNKYQIYTCTNGNSFAVVKSSSDPQKDFRESMVEMVKENNIRYSRDFQELLRCYLSLNSDEYHDIIKRAFEQVRSGFRKNRK